MKHPGEELLILHHYGETDGAAVEQHLEGCAECRSEYAELTAVFGAVTSVPLPERSESYPQEVWQRVRAGAHERSRVRWDWRLLFSPPRLSLAAGLVVLLLGAFLFGRFGPGGPANGEAISPQVRERILLVAVGDHLERSQSLLIELTHTDGDGPVDIARQQVKAEELASNNRIYRQTATRAGDESIGELLDELEMVLLEIANGPSNLAPAALGDLQTRIAKRGILFKIRVVGEKTKKTSLPSHV